MAAAGSYPGAVPVETFADSGGLPREAYTVGLRLPAPIPNVAQVCTGADAWEAPAPAPRLETQSTVSYRPSITPLRRRRRAPKGFGASMLLTPKDTRMTHVENYPYDEEWRSNIMTAESWRPATTIRRSPATGLHQLEIRAGKALEGARRGEGPRRKDTFVPNKRELGWKGTKFNPLFVKYDWVGPTPSEQGAPTHASGLIRMATLRKMRELRARDPRALRHGIFVQLHNVPPRWLEKGYRAWSDVDAGLLDRLTPGGARAEGSLYSTVDRANLSAAQATLPRPRRGKYA